HELYSLVPHIPCVVIRLLANSLFKQPQDLERPSRKLCPFMSRQVPQVQTQDHITPPAGAMTRQRPNRFPTRSILVCLARSSVVRQPLDLESPLRRLCPRTSARVPQSQTQNHRLCPA